MHIGKIGEDLRNPVFDTIARNMGRIVGQKRLDEKLQKRVNEPS